MALLARGRGRRVMLAEEVMIIRQGAEDGGR
jgi:hypothetical protein